MYNGIGLPTPRGSGTSGYIQRNLGFARPPRADGKDKGKTIAERAPKIRKANEELLKHEAKRELEIEVTKRRIQLEDEEVSEEEIERQVAKFRKAREEEAGTSSPIRSVLLVSPGTKIDVSKMDTHQLAKLKQAQNASFKDSGDVDRGSMRRKRPYVPAEGK